MGISRFVLGRRTKSPVVSEVVNGAKATRVPRARKVTSMADGQRRVKNPTLISRPSA
jgi:hypothetical protein